MTNQRTAARGSLRAPRAASLLRWVGVSLSSLLLSAPALAEGHEELPERGLARVVVELEDLQRFSAEELLDALVVAGPRALEELKDSLDAEGGTTPDPELPLLPLKQRAQYERALSKLPDWVAQLVDPVAGSSRLDVARAQIAQEALVSSELEGACAALLAISSPRRTEAPANQAVVKSFESALSARLRLRPREARELDDLLERAHPELRHAIIRAAGKSPTSESSNFLTRVLDDDPSLDLMVLAELARIYGITHEPLDPSVEMRISMHLVSSNAALRRQACLAAGRLELFDLTSQLIGLLSDEDSGIRTNALWALERIAAKTMAADPATWKRWHKAELTWWSGEARAAFAALQHGEPYEVGAALRTLSGHRFYRHQIAEELVLVLQREEDFLVAQACASLGALRSGRAIPDLGETLLHESEAAREAAMGALRLISGRRDLGRDPAEWVAAGVLPDILGQH